MDHKMPSEGSAGLYILAQLPSDTGMIYGKVILHGMGVWQQLNDAGM